MWLMMMKKIVQLDLSSVGINVIHFRMNEFSFQLLYKVSFSYSKCYPFFLFSVLCVSRRLDQVLCWRVVGTVIDLNIVSVH